MAIAPLNLVPVEKGSDRLILEEDFPAFLKFKPPRNRNMFWSAASTLFTRTGVT